MVDKKLKEFQNSEKIASMILKKYNNMSDALKELIEVREGRLYDDEIQMALKLKIERDKRDKKTLNFKETHDEDDFVTRSNLICSRLINSLMQTYDIMSDLWDSNFVIDRIGIFPFGDIKEYINFVTNKKLNMKFFNFMKDAINRDIYRMLLTHNFNSTIAIPISDEFGLLIHITTMDIDHRSTRAEGLHRAIYISGHIMEHEVLPESIGRLAMEISSSIS